MAKTNVPALPDESTSKGRRSKSKAVATMADIERMYAVEATEAAAAAPLTEGVPRITAKDGVFWYGEQELPDPLRVIVVADAHLNVLYDPEEEYDPENPTPPWCFALAPALQLNSAGEAVVGTGEAAMGAHPNSPKPQGGAQEGSGPAHPCTGCEHNAFGSAARGRGKACHNTRQLAVVMADDPAFSSSDASLPKYAVLGLSATGLGPWAKFVQGLSKVEKRPPHGAIIKFSFNKKDPDERKRKAVIPVGYDLVRDVAMATKVNQLRREILESKVLLRPLPTEIRSDKKAKVPKGGKKGKAGAKKEPRRAARF